MIYKGKGYLSPVTRLPITSLFDYKCLAYLGDAFSGTILFKFILIIVLVGISLRSFGQETYVFARNSPNVEEDLAGYHVYRVDSTTGFSGAELKGYQVLWFDYILIKFLTTLRPNQ